MSLSGNISRFGLVLKQEWAKGISRANLGADIAAGLTVGCVAIPLSLAIALASGVRPELGLVSAIIGGIVAALFGGTRLAVTGPAAAMAVLIASCVERFGVEGMLMIGLICGVLQVASGLLGLGRFARFVPTPVVAGFTAGIGAIILIGQLPKALGLEMNGASSPLSMVRELIRGDKPIQLVCVWMSLGTAFITLVLPRFAARIPAALVGVVLFSVLAWAAGWQVPLIGTIPDRLPAPALMSFQATDWSALISAAVIVWALASIETLLSSAAVDKMVKNSRHDPDLELVGQGLANVAVSFFGGVPVTGVIARSGLNAAVGAKTRRAAVIHSIFVLISIYLLSQWISYIPISVLAGILIAAAIKMLHPAELVRIWKSSRIEAVVSTLTFVTILGADLIVGVQAGIVAAFVIAALRLGQLSAMVHAHDEDGPVRIEMEGPLTFLAVSKLEILRKKVFEEGQKRGVIFDLSQIQHVDYSGAEQFIEILRELKGRSVLVAVIGLADRWKDVFQRVGSVEGVLDVMASSEKEAMSKIGDRKHSGSVVRLQSGVNRFRRKVRPKYEPLLRTLAESQSPHTLFITCADSRIDPNLITTTLPGELFVVRNVGNLIPKYGADSKPGEGAAIEFAVAVLGVKNIVICGHSGCGAVRGALHGVQEVGVEGGFSESFACLKSWLSDLTGLREDFKKHGDIDLVAEKNVLVQVQNLLTYPTVAQRVADGSIRIHPWFYNLRDADLLHWQDVHAGFVAIQPQSVM